MVQTKQEIREAEGVIVVANSQYEQFLEILSNVVSELLSIPSVFFIFKPLSLVLLRP